MKKTVILLLAALMVMALFVSCKDEPKMQTPDKKTVEYVSRIIKRDFFYDYFRYIVGHEIKEKTEDNLASLQDAIETELSNSFLGIEVKATVTESSISAHETDSDNNTLDVLITDLSMDENEVISGNFVLKTKESIGGTVLRVEAKGSFEIDPDDNSTINCSSATMNNNNYEVEKINKELNQRFS